MRGGGLQINCRRLEKALQQQVSEGEKLEFEFDGNFAQPTVAVSFEAPEKEKKLKSNSC